MKICMIGDFSPNLDEGYKNTSHYLAAGLDQRHTVVRLNAKRAGSVAFWTRLALARPQIIHTIAQPTNQSLVLTGLLRRARPQARTVISALRAERYFPTGRVERKQRLMLRAARPDLFLVQTRDAAQLFADAACPVAQLPNGVDLDRFRPVSSAQQRVLRRKYGIPPRQPVVLHVGHLHAARNLLALAPLPAQGMTVLVAGSLYMGTHSELIAQLEQAGFHLLCGYQPHVEELYQLADCYVFPTQPGDSITMPLSVLEAMGCNLPVVTTRFAGLEQAFKPAPGFTFIDDGAEILPAVQAALAVGPACGTRAMVEALSWEAVATRLTDYYERLVAA